MRIARWLMLGGLAGSALARPVAAQALPLAIGAGGGPTFSEQGRGTGYHGLITVGVGLPGLPVRLRADGLLARFTDSTRTQLASVSANLVYSLLPVPLVTPYLVGGVGYYNTRLSRVTDRTDSDVGVNLGAGVRVSLLVVGGFVEVRYHNVFGRDVAGVRRSQRFVPLTFGIRL